MPSSVMLTTMRFQVLLESSALHAAEEAAEEAEGEHHEEESDSSRYVSW